MKILNRQDEQPKKGLFQIPGIQLNPGSECQSRNPIIFTQNMPQNIQNTPFSIFDF
jgi:hypothetical protein